MKPEQDLFPHTGFPIRLEYQDRNDRRTCWFQSQNHLDKHVTRYKINLKEAKLDYQDPAMAKPLPVVVKPEDAPVKRGRKPKQQLFSSLEQFFEPNETSVAPVGTSDRGESTQKRRRGRPSSNH